MNRGFARLRAQGQVLAAADLFNFLDDLMNYMQPQSLGLWKSRGAQKPPKKQVLKWQTDTAP